METVFAIALTMLLAVGAIQVALTLYARNVVAAAAHEGARAAIERGAAATGVVQVVRGVVLGAAGKTVRDMEVDAGFRERAGVRRITVRVRGVLRTVGPIPLPVPVDVTASASSTQAVP